MNWLIRDSRAKFTFSYRVRRRGEPQLSGTVNIFADLERDQARELWRDGMVKLLFLRVGGSKSL